MRPNAETGAVIFTEPKDPPNPTLNIRSTRFIALVRLLPLFLVLLGAGLFTGVVLSPPDPAYPDTAGAAALVFAVAAVCGPVADFLFRRMQYSLTPIVLTENGVRPPTTLDERVLFRKPAFVAWQDIRRVEFRKDARRNVYKPPVARMTLKARDGTVWRTSDKVAAGLDDVRRIMVEQWPQIEIHLSGDGWATDASPGNGPSAKSRR